MDIWGMTDPGLVRSENQDAYAVRVSEESGFTVCVVCDGMGGPGGGKLAGELAVEAFLSSCLANHRAGMDPAQVQEVAEFAVAAANTAVYERSVRDNLRGMGPPWSPPWFGRARPSSATWATAGPTSSAGRGSRPSAG